jgi:23S rRNA (adenine2503-C2)-methyltransferase
MRPAVTEAVLKTAQRPGAAAPERPRLAGMAREDLRALLTAAGEPEEALRMRTNQLFHWIYHQGGTDLDGMTTMSKELRTALTDLADVGRDEVAREQHSADGTVKWLIRLHDGALVEAVYIPEEDRGALCVSTQVGCTLNCSFCHTGTQPWVRNLEAAEIVGQVLVARDALGEWPTPTGGRLITNIVLMGMGEPLLNYDNVVAALRLVMDEAGIAISRRRITVSTAGVVPKIAPLGEDTGAGLAVSLHAVRDDVRDELVPLNRKYPLAELLEACRAYPGSSNARRITFEYAMLKGVNDGVADAKELARKIAGIPAKVNLIPFNPWPGTVYSVSDDEVIEAFAEILNRAGYSAPIRTPRGRDILAACGQLKSASVRVRASQRGKVPPPA